MDERHQPYQVAGNATKCLLDVVNSTGDIPLTFWRDPFVLGFLFFYIHSVAVRAGAKPGNYEDIPSAYISMRGGYDGIDVLKRTMACSLKENPIFRQGLEAADKFISIVYGSQTYDDAPDVISARKRALATKIQLQNELKVDLSDVEHAFLLETIFLSKVRCRLGMGTVTSRSARSALR